MADGQGMEQVEGGIEAITGRLLSGWCRVADAGAFAEPPAGMSLSLHADGAELGATLAEYDAARDKMIFEFMLPRAIFDGQAHVFAAQVAGSVVALENATQLLGAPDAAPIGFLEQISEDGWVIGWAWYPEQPELRVEVELLVDGHVAGTAHAGLFRADVAEAGKGDGCYGFSWPLPFSVLAMARDVTISARDKRTGAELPDPLVFRQKTVTDAFSKIAELEHDVRLLNETIKTLEFRKSADEREAGELFRTVGEFFMELAAASAAGTPLAALRPVKSLAEEVTAGLEGFAFAPCEAPEVSIFVAAGPQVAGTYAALRAVQAGLGEVKAEVFLLDDGACAQTPLLAMVAQNMRYARLPGGLAAARCNDAMRLAGGDLAVFLASGVQVSGAWAEALAVFAARPILAGLAARVADADGVLVSAGVELNGGDVAARGRWAEVRAAVDAVAPEMFAVRRAAWEQLGGLDEGYYGLGAALVEFCLRARMGGGAIGYEPGFGGVLSGAVVNEVDVEGRGSDSRRLRAVIGSFREAAE
jgi:hypothetical protein